MNRNVLPTSTIIGLLILFVSPASLAEEPFKTFQNVDNIVAQDVSRFAKLFKEGETRVVRIALFGDSQETAPGGGGRVYLPRLNYELFKHYGNSPETLIEPLASAQYAWLQRSGLLTGEVIDLGDCALPDIRVVQLLGEGNAYLVALQHTGEGLLTQTLLPGEATTFFRTDGVVKAEIFVVTQRGSGPIQYEARPHDRNNVNYYVPSTTSGLLELNLDNENEGRILSTKTLPLDFAGKKYLQLHLNSGEADKSVQVVGMRFVNETHAHGVVINDFSHGGYRLANLLKSHSNAGEMYRAFKFDTAILHLGANDCGGVSAVEFKKQTEQVIAMIRKWMKDPNYKIILMGDPDLKTHSKDSPKRAEFDQYPGAQAAIAMADPNVLVVNSRRIADERFNWRFGHKKLDDYLADQVHYSTEGGRILAEAEMKVLLSILSDQ